MVNAQRSIDGFLLRDGQKRIAILSGTLNADDSFRMTATDTEGHRTAAVTGTFTSQVSTISIHGDAASACDGQTFTLRLGSYFANQGGGGGGGGN